MFQVDWCRRKTRVVVEHPYNVIQKQKLQSNSLAAEVDIPKDTVMTKFCLNLLFWKRTASWPCFCTARDSEAWRQVVPQRKSTFGTLCFIFGWVAANDPPTSWNHRNRNSGTVFHHCFGASCWIGWKIQSCITLFVTFFSCRSSSFISTNSVAATILFLRVESIKPHSTALQQILNILSLEPLKQTTKST